jgi:hypothetical protein
MPDIPAGYQLHVTTWENDGDYYKTTVLSGLTKEDTNFLVSIAKQFSRKGKYGNDFIKDTDLIEVISNALESSSGITLLMRADWQEALQNSIDEGDGAYPLHELLSDSLLGNPEEDYSPGFCRVVETIEVYFIPKAVSDITKEFI